MLLFRSKLFFFVVIGFALYASMGTATDRKLDQNHTESPVVNLPNCGILRGSTTRSARSNAPIFQFLGVRYAESPSGNRRFKAPVPVKPWQGERHATAFGRKCPEFNDLSQMTEADRENVDLEDCLNLQVYSKNLNGRAPVMVYIHGGGLYKHSAVEYPPDYILVHNVVLVVLQYRLDALGFLCTNTKDIPGNAGLLDVLLALKWIKSYIRYFGGNPDQITLFGQSAGGKIISALAISPVVPNGLFQRIIVESGSVFSTHTYTLEPIKDARNIARCAGLDPCQKLRSLNRAFMKMNIYDLLKAVSEHYNVTKMGGTLSLAARAFTIGGPTNFLPDLPHKIPSNVQCSKDLAVITGCVKDDGLFIAPDAYDILESNGLLNDKNFMTHDFINALLKFVGIDDSGGSISGLVANTYWTKEQMLKGDFREYSAGVIDAPVLAVAQANARCNPNKTFLYTFDYSGEYTKFAHGAKTSKYPFKGGVYHSDEDIYLFPYPSYFANLNEVDTEVSRKLVGLWTSFAISGVPKIRNDFGEKETVLAWPPLMDVVGPYIHINRKLSVGQNFIDEYTVRTRSARGQI